jgi:hypothetical protein
MPHLSVPFLKKLVHCLEEEEMDIYMLTLYSMNSDDMNYFVPKDRERVRTIFQTLMEDTRYHSQLLKLIIQMGEKANGKQVL